MFTISGPGSPSATESGSAEPLLEQETIRPSAADALVAMAETTLAHGPTPVAGGDRPMVPTDLDNLVLLCRVHHRAIHHRGYTCETGPHQTFKFFNPHHLRLLPVPPPPPSDGDIPTMGASGEQIGPDTPVPNWDGHHPDYASAVEGLLILEAEGRPDEVAVA